MMQESSTTKTMAVDGAGDAVNAHSDGMMDMANNSSDLDVVDRLKFFLATAPSTFASPSSPAPSCQVANNAQDAYVEDNQRFRRFLLPNGEHISCVLWNGLYHITGTDIIRTLVFRMRAFGRRISNQKKFEEGVFSDLRNLKSGTDATLEVPKSPLLDLLFKNNCIRTQKKQKVFYWFSVPHDKLFLDALEKDARREKTGHDPASIAVAEPALSFRYNPSLPLLEQLKSGDVGGNGGNSSSNSSNGMLDESASLHAHQMHQPHQQEQQSAIEPQLCIKIETMDSAAMHDSEYNNLSTRTPYSPAGPYIPSSALWSSSTSPTGTPFQVGPETNEHQLVMQSHHLASVFNTPVDRLYPFNQIISQPNQQSLQALAATSYAPILEQEQLGQTEQIRFICPWYTCGDLFTCLPALVKHISQHSIPATHPSPSHLQDFEANTVSQSYQASLAQSDAETALLLDVLKSSSALPTSSYSSPGSAPIERRSPAMGAYNPHVEMQERTVEITRQAFMLAPAPSIRKRGD